MYKAQLSTRFSFLLLLVSCAIITSGCGDGRPARVKVSGNVTVQGEPLKFGGLSFKPVEGGRLAFGSFDANGKFSVMMYEENDGLPPGSYTVSINALEQINERTQRWHAPKSYSDHKTSGFTIEITEETTDLDFDLTWEGDKHSKPWVEKL